MIDQEMQSKLDRSTMLMDNARSLFATSNFDESEQSANAVLELLESHVKRNDLGDELDRGSQKHRLMYHIGHAYNRLNTISMARSDYQLAITQAEIAMSYAKRLGYQIRVADLMTNIASIYKNLGSFDKALLYFSQALIIQEELQEAPNAARTIMGIGNVYLSLGNHDKALLYYSKALVIFEEYDEKTSIAEVMMNMGIIYKHSNNYEVALEYMYKSLHVHEALGKKSGVARITASIGSVYLEVGAFQNALECYYKALSYHEELGEKSSVAHDLGNIGLVYLDQQFGGFDEQKAKEFLLKSIEISEKIGAKQLSYIHHRNLAEIYRNEKQWEEFALHFEKYHVLEKEVQSEEAKKAVELMEHRRQAEEREKEMAIAHAKHEATEQLLHNVLPPSIANKMLDGTKLIAEKLPSVSVLFADIVNFTKLSQRITPEELVEGLDRIFSTFDALAEKYGLEKIKTIGDAYMVVSGAPVQRDDHAEVMAHFALEMVEAMKEFRSISTGEEIQLRIGIHSGEVVAGVIGKKKFAYDMWGDAVNTASRMESHGEPGKIHVSEEFMQAFLLGTGRQGQPPTSPMSPLFTNRGELTIKGKGIMNTYFLEKR